MIEIHIKVGHGQGMVHVIEQAPVTVDDSEDLVERTLKAAVTRAHHRARTALITPMETLGDNA